ncbi:NUDIX hydrolase [Pseudactinotalea sp. HY158]|uniref:NUDIX hydrolase n=1 Tax=unclassified Pseudactinotalea TaxID=2649176 RepID=UPI00128C5965|nr:NUDIX domain-containing protein [Pseudactinotalea sp. HY158]MPV49605.1 NUDIX domain-containing protein [Pseudactinotalea sp. HY160]
MPDLAAALSTTLVALGAEPWAAGEPLRAEYAAFLAADPGRVHRTGPEHFTASAMVFTPDLAQILLCLHGKAGFWVQLGGHLEADDPTPLAGALREAREESGLSDVVATRDLPIDLNRHELASEFGRCRAHWDVVYALTAEPRPPVVSPESKDVRWFPTSSLPPNCAPGFEAQVDAALARLRPAQHPAR